MLIVLLIITLCLAHSSPSSMKSRYHVVGGGPVGFAVAIMLAKEGIPSVVYERNQEGVRYVPEESYPIGVNQRGLHALGEIGLREEVEASGRRVSAWEIHGSRNRKVAQQDSGTVVGISRGELNLLLAEAAGARPDMIEIVNNMKLMEVEEGVHSVARAVIAAATNSMQRVTPWRCEFRVLFGRKGPEACDVPLDKSRHYIFNGLYVASVGCGDGEQWAVTVGVRDDCSGEERSLLLATCSSPERIQALRVYLRTNAPRVEPLISDAELERYFERRTFRGAIVECEQYHLDEWLLVVGDAAHSVIPPTGEGVNSGLEDVSVLAACVREASSAPSPKPDPRGSLTAEGKDPFAMYSRKRSADLKALANYADFLNDAFDPKMPGEAGARVAFLVLEKLLSKLGVLRSPSVNDSLFGEASIEREPYGPMLRRWGRRKAVLLSLGRLLVYPIAWWFLAIRLAVQTIWRTVILGLTPLLAVLFRFRSRPVGP